MAKILAVIFSAILTLCAILFVLYQVYLSPEKPPAKQVFINAQVLSMNANNAIFEAVAVEQDRIVAVGSNVDIQALIDDSTVVHDLQGKTLIPGFIDAHSHFPGFGTGIITVDLNSPPIGTVNSIADIQHRLRKGVDSLAAGKWLIGVGYDDSLLAEKRHPTRHDLDAISTTVPIYLMHISGHISVVNSVGLDLLNLSADTPDPEGGVYVRDENAQLTGVLEETARIKATELAFDISLMDFLAMVKKGAAEYAAAGVTTAQSGLATEQVIQGLTFAKMLGVLPQRLVLWPDMEAGERWVDKRFDAERYSSENVSIGAVKLVADGSIQGYTGYLGQPYHVHSDDHQEDYRGYATMPQEELNARILALHKAGLQVAVHANGDAAIESVITAVAAAQQQAPRKDARHIVIHSQMATKEQLLKMQRWGLTPSFFSAHTYYWGDRHRDIFLGPERAAHISPTRSAQELGIPFTVHLDTPVVPMSPLFGLWTTVNRISSSGAVIGEDERIDVMPALRAVTIDAAWQVFLEEDRGSIEVGKKADLVVLDKNPLLHAATIKDIQVLTTFIGGVVIYPAK